MNEHAAFLEERRKGIGGTDAAVILGLSKYKTPLQLAQEKLGQTESFQGNRFTEAGNRLEDVIARWYADATGWKIARVNKTLRLSNYPYIMAHVDRRVLNRYRVLECKSADKWTMSQWGEEGSDEVPDIYFIQVQHYLMFPSFLDGDLAALIGGNDFRIYHIDPDRELQDMILRAEIEFWNTIKRGDLPQPVNQDDTKRLWPRDNGNVIFANDQVIQWHEQLKETKKAQEDLKKRLDELKTNIQKYMKDYTILRDPQGNVLHSWKEQALSGFKENLLKEAHPDIFNEYKKEVLDKQRLKQDKPDVYKTYQITGRVFR
ncbi:MAG: YqaJ viral recombinase family protein [Spirochaetia bacterium]|nr:YqaJ viral recombinase family protein [Spirochaetia bacterium]